MPGLIKSLKRTDQYSLGGVVGVLAIPTLLDSGAAGFTVTRDAITGIVTGITPAVANAFQVIEPEVDTASYTENLKVGSNRYLEQALNLNYGTLSVLTSVAMQALNLGRHTFVLKLKTGIAVLLGERNGLTVTKNDGGAGAKNEDAAGYSLTLTGGETVHVAVFPSAVFDTLAATVTD